MFLEEGYEIVIKSPSEKLWYSVLERVAEDYHSRNQKLATQADLFLDNLDGCFGAICEALGLEETWAAKKIRSNHKTIRNSSNDPIHKDWEDRICVICSDLYTPRRLKQRTCGQLECKHELSRRRAIVYRRKLNKKAEQEKAHE